MIQLTAVTQQLLHTQVRLPGCFRLKLINISAPFRPQPIHATLHITQLPDHIRLSFRAEGTHNTLTLPKQPAETLAHRVAEWIEACANGTLDTAKVAA